MFSYILCTCVRKLIKKKELTLMCSRIKNKAFMLYVNSDMGWSGITGTNVKKKYESEMNIISAQKMYMTCIFEDILEMNQTHLLRSAIITYTFLYSDMGYFDNTYSSDFKTFLLMLHQLLYYYIILI